MKYLILLCALIFGSCQNTTKIYIVRHAEKNITPANDPQLSQAGLRRAEELKEVLKGKNIGNIFSTNTYRTRETAMPLSMQINVPMQLYVMDTVKRFLAHVSNMRTNVLVIGHSNTLLPMLDYLGVQHTVTAIGDYTYNNLFIVTVKKGKAVKVEETTYGAENPAK